MTPLTRRTQDGALIVTPTGAVFDAPLREALAALLDALEREPPAAGLVLVIDALDGPSPDWRERATRDPDAARAAAEAEQRLLARLAALPQTIAAVSVRATGTAFELALACRGLVVTPGATLGLTQVALGLLPWADGCRRLPERAGLARAIPWICRGETFHGAEAAEVGLALEAAEPAGLTERAVALLADPRLDRRPRPVRPWWLRWAEASRHGRRVIYASSGAALGAALREAYPAPQAALRVIEVAREEGPETGALTALTALGKLLETSSTRGMLHLDRCRRWATVDAPTPALWLLGEGPRTTELAAALPSARSEGAPSPGALAIDADGTADRAAWQRRAPGSWLAVDPGVATVAEVAARLPAPDRVLGLAFPAPVAGLPLLELRQAHPALDGLASALGRPRIVVTDVPGGLTCRLLVAGLCEAVRLLGEGATVTAIEQAHLHTGAAVGPLALADRVGLARLRTLAEALCERVDARFAPPAALIRLTDAGREQLMDHAQVPARVDPAVYQDLGRPEPRRFARDALTGPVRERMRIEALQAQTMASAEAVDLTAVLGAGYPACLGGPRFDPKSAA